MTEVHALCCQNLPLIGTDAKYLNCNSGGVTFIWWQNRFEKSIQCHIGTNPSSRILYQNLMKYGRKTRYSLDNRHTCFKALTLMTSIQRWKQMWGLISTSTTLSTSTYPWPMENGEMRTLSAVPKLFLEHTQQGMDMTRVSLPTLQNILWWVEECLASGRPFHSSLLSLHLQVICWPHPSSCLIKSISPPWRKRRGTLYVIDQNIPRNLGREWSIRDILQYICFYWVRLYLQFGLALESQVPDTWALTSQLFHIHDTHISHLEENLTISTRPTSSFSNWTVTHYPEFLWCLYIILLTYLIKNTIKVGPPPWSLKKSFNPLTSLSFSFFFCKSNSWNMAITMPASQTVVTIRWDKSGKMLQNLKSKENHRI